MKRFWKFLCDQDWLIVAIPMLIMTALFFSAGLTSWGIMFSLIMAVFGLMEAGNYFVYQKTISQQFAKFLKERKIFAWIILWSMGIFWACLLCHLLTTGG